MEVKFEVKMTPEIMYDFLMNHTYKSPTGVFGVLFGLSAVAVLIVTFGTVDAWQSTLYAVFGIWFIAYLPITLYMRSRRQVKTNPIFKNPITYIINDEGITTSQEEQSAQILWEDMIKVRETRKSLLVYTGKRYSFILPKEDMGEQYQDAVTMIQNHMKTKKVKIKSK